MPTFTEVTPDVAAEALLLYAASTRPTVPEATDAAVPPPPPFAKDEGAGLRTLRTPPFPFEPSLPR